jgi:hypothetical protein
MATSSSSSANGKRKAEASLPVDEDKQKRARTNTVRLLRLSSGDSALTTLICGPQEVKGAGAQEAEEDSGDEGDVMKRKYTCKTCQ